MNCLLWNRSGELKMSRNVMSTMIRILDVLKDYVSDEHKHRIKIEKCNIKANLDDETPAIEFVAKTKCFVKVLQNSFFNVFEYNGCLYIMAPSKSEALLTRLGLNPIDDIVIYQGIGMIAISKKALPIRKGIQSLDLIERILGDKIEEIFFSEITELFEPYSIFEIQADRFAIEYEEDVDRLCALMALDESAISTSSKVCLENLLLLQSSRGLSVALSNAINSFNWDYSYLQLYHCLEYLFIIRNAMLLSEEYKIEDDAAIDIASSGKLRALENESLLAVLALAPELPIESFYDTLIFGKGEYESEDRKSAVSKYIYKLRCCIAHLRFEQENFDLNDTQDKVFDKLVEIIYGIYSQNDAEISKACNSKSPWHIILWLSK